MIDCATWPVDAELRPHRDQTRSPASELQHNGIEVSKPPNSEPDLVTGSALLQELQDGVPSGQFTLEWLVSCLRKQSFPAMIFLLAIVAILPGISLVAGLLLLVPTVQMIAGQPAPTFPRRIATRPLSTDKLNACLRRIIPILKVVEVAIHPRWPRAVTVPKRIVGLVILLFSRATAGGADSLKQYVACRPDQSHRAFVSRGGWTDARAGVGDRSGRPRPGRKDSTRRHAELDEDFLRSVASFLARRAGGVIE